MASKRKRDSPQTYMPAISKLPPFNGIGKFTKSVLKATGKANLEEICALRRLSAVGTKMDLIDAILDQQEAFGLPGIRQKKKKIAAIQPRARTPSEERDSGNFTASDREESQRLSTTSSEALREEREIGRVFSVSSNSISQSAVAHKRHGKSFSWIDDLHQEVQMRNLDVGLTAASDHFLLLRLLHYESAEFLKQYPAYAPQLKKMIDILVANTPVPDNNTVRGQVDDALVANIPQLDHTRISKHRDLVANSTSDEAESI